MGLVQVDIKHLYRIELDTFVLLILQDKRHRNFSNSILSIVESNLDNVLVYFNCYPSFILSLSDPNILRSLMIDIKILNMDWEP